MRQMYAINEDPTGGKKWLNWNPASYEWEWSEDKGKVYTSKEDAEDLCCWLGGYVVELDLQGETS